MSDSNQQKNSSSESHQESRSLAEWVTFSISLSLLAGICGLVFYDWFATQHEPPVLEVIQDGEIRAAQGQFYVPFKVTNTGGSTAESVQVMAQLRINGEVEQTQTGEQQIDFLSGGETDRGAFIFSKNPSEGELILRVGSYKLP